MEAVADSLLLLINSALCLCVCLCLRAVGCNTYFLRELDRLPLLMLRLLLPASRFFSRCCCCCCSAAASVSVSGATFSRSRCSRRSMEAFAAAVGPHTAQCMHTPHKPRQQRGRRRHRGDTGEQTESQREKNSRRQGQRETRDRQPHNPRERFVWGDTQSGALKKPARHPSHGVHTSATPKP